jgi:hypothetical protein
VGQPEADNECPLFTEPYAQMFLDAAAGMGLVIADRTAAADRVMCTACPVPEQTGYFAADAGRGTSLRGCGWSRTKAIHRLFDT